MTEVIKQLEDQKKENDNLIAKHSEDIKNLKAANKALDKALKANIYSYNNLNSGDTWNKADGCSFEDTNNTKERKH